MVVNSLTLSLKGTAITVSLVLQAADIERFLLSMIARSATGEPRRWDITQGTADMISVISLLNEIQPQIMNRDV